MPSTAIWTRVHTINYRQMTNSASAVPAVSTAIGGASSAAASNRSRTSGGANPSQASKTSKKPSKTPKRASSAPIVDELWINGQCPPVKSLLHLALNESISSSLTINDLSLNAISLLHILNSLNLYWYDLYLDTNAMIGHPNSSLTLNVKQGFLSSKLTSKVNRQLQDPVVIMMGQCPSWITEIGYKCSFLFPFETRQMIFFTCAFDRERAMQRLVDSSEMFTQQHQQQQNDAADRQPGGPRIERKKIQLSRGNILPEMEKVLENWNSKQILEVQYEDEVNHRERDFRVKERTTLICVLGWIWSWPDIGSLFISVEGTTEKWIGTVENGQDIGSDQRFVSRAISLRSNSSLLPLFREGCTHS